jgi:urease accessory protein
LFEYFTNEAIPYARSRVQRYTRIVMDPSSSLFATDLVSAGRIHYGDGEIFMFDSLVSVFEIIAGNRRLVLDRLVATQRKDIEALGRLWNGAYHMGTIFAYAPDLPEGVEDAVRERSEEISDIQMGVSRIGNMVVVRVLSHETWQAHEATYHVWEVLRPPIAGKPARPIRTGAFPVGTR